jgi:putative membrane protein
MGRIRRLAGEFHMRSIWGACVAASALAVASCNNPNAADKSAPNGAATDRTADATATMPSDSGMAPPTGADGAQPASAVPANAVDVPTFVQTAASGDMFEIRSSQLAMKESENRQVRDFAQLMVKDHQASTAALKQAVSEGARGTTVPTEMMPRHAQMLRALEQAANGTDAAAFDRLYLEQQRTAHAEALDLHRSMAARGDMPAPLKAFADATAKTVEGHHQSLMQMPAAAGTAATSGTVNPATGQAQL